MNSRIDYTNLNKAYYLGFLINFAKYILLDPLKDTYF